MVDNIITTLTRRKNALISKRESLAEEYRRNMVEVNREIEKIDAAIEVLNNAVSEYICPRCQGTGTERYCDAAGDIDGRECTACKGTGIRI